MKTLEQLGISPTPWKVAMDDIAMVFGGSQYPSLSTLHICEVDIIDDPERKCNDIKLIAAAPDMYEALYESVKEKCTECHQINDYESDIDVEWQMCKGCPVKKWRAALAKAAGESEVK